MILRYYYRVGGLLHRCRFLLWLALLAALLGVMRMIFADAPQSERYLFPLMVASAWLGLSLTMAYHSATPLPEIDPRASWWSRCKLRWRRRFSYALAMLVIISSVVLLWISNTMLRLLLQC